MDNLTLAQVLAEMERFESHFRKAVYDDYTMGVSMADFLTIKTLNNMYNAQKIGETFCCGNELLKALKIAGSWYFSQKSQTVKVTTDLKQPLKKSKK